MAGIILAAGMGRRLGLGPKAFVSFQGASLLEQAVARLRRCGVAPIVAVLPPGPDPIDVPDDLIVVRNADAASGPLGSASLGARALPSTLQGALLYPVDHYAVSDQDLRCVLAMHPHVAPDESRIVPYWQGRGGHPVLLMNRALKALREVVDPSTLILRDVLDASGAICRVEAASGGVRCNLNTSDDWPSEA